MRKLILTLTCALLALSMAVPALANSADAYRNMRENMEAEDRPTPKEQDLNFITQEEYEAQLAGEEELDYTDQWGINPDDIANFSDSAMREKRIAIYMNRKFSDRTKEWITPVRASSNTTVYGNKQSSGTMTQGGQVTNSNNSSDIGVSGQTTQGLDFRMVDQPRQGPGEESAWMWEFQDGFMNAFLEAGANLVDRSVITRLQGAESLRGKNEATVNEQTIEVDALKGYADIFIELLASPKRSSSKSPYNYDLKAMAKEVKTGRILAMVTSMKWPPYKKKSKQEVMMTTDEGVSFQNVEDIEYPDVREAGEKMACELMRRLARR